MHNGNRAHQERESGAGSNTKPLNVLHIYKFLYDGGTERYIHTLISRMNPERYRFQICCLMERGTDAERFEKEGYPVHTLGFKPGLSPRVMPGNLIQLYKLARLIRRLDIDVVHTHDNQPAFYARLAAKLAGVKLVFVTLHNDYTWISNLQHRINRLLAGLTTRLFTVSATVRDISIDKDRIAPDKYSVIYNGVHFPDQPDPEQIRRYHDEWQLSDRSRIIGNVASLSERKGQACLLHAFGRIAEQYPDTCLFIVGSERDDEPEVPGQLAQIARDYGIEQRVIFTGSRNDVLSLINLFELYIMPSIVEGFGLSLVEAMTAGVPAITSDIPTFVEISQQGKYALLSRTDDPDDLAEKLRHALDNPDDMKSLGRSAMAYARHHFSIEHMVSEYERCYEEDIISAGPGPGQ